MPNHLQQKLKFCEALGQPRACFDRMLKVFDCVGAGVVVANAGGELLYWNPAAIHLHGYRDEVEVRRPLEDFPEKFQLSNENGVLSLEDWPMSRLLRGEALKSEELMVRRLDTGQRWVFAYDGEVLGADGGDSQDLFVLTIRDLTAERQAQSELRQAAELFRAVTEFSEDAIFVKDLQGKYLHFNSAAARLTNKVAAQVLGQDDQLVFEPDVAKKVQRIDRLVMDQEQTLVWEEVLFSGGVQRTLQTSNAPYRDPSGKVIGLVGIARDITSKKDYEQQLLAERARLERMAAVAPGNLYTYHMSANGRHRFAYVTPALEELYGVPRALLEDDARNAFRRVHPEDRPRIQESITRSAGALEQWVCQYRVMHPQRGEIWLEGRSCPVPDGEGGVFWHGVMMDITEHKQTTADLKAEKERFQSIVDSVPGAIYSFCMRPDGSTCIPYASPALGFIFGIDPEELKLDASPLFEMISPGHLQEVLVSIEHSRDNLEPWLAQIPFHHETRGTCWVDGQSVPTRLPDGGTIWHGYLWDSTERRSLEQQFLQAQKMDAVGRLAGGVAHDFNNLLTVINGHADLLIKQVQPEDPIQSSLKQIRKAGERSARLTRQLLAFSRQAPIEPSVFDANAQIVESQKMLGRLVGEDIDFQLDLSPHPLPIVLDPIQFDQVLLNLVVNARDAMPTGGTLSIATQPRNGEMRLEVRDSGCGMSQATISRIFEPFFTTKEAGKGTGLGLAVVHGVVTSGGGRIEVESQPRQGTLFRIFFPLTEKPVAAPALVPEEPFCGSETILVVEDDPAVRRVLVMGLQKYGYKVLVASSGKSAVQIARRTQDPIHLMLSDVVMPGVSGPEAAQQIYQQRPDLKILFMTGYTEDTRIPSSILRKPFTAQGAAEKIRHLLDQP